MVLGWGRLLRLKPGQTRLHVVLGNQRQRLAMVIDNQRPVIKAHGHIRQGNIRLRTLRQRFETATQIVAKQAQRAALKGQIRIRCGR